MPRTAFAVALLLAACGAPTAQGTGANTAASGSGAGSDCHEETPTGTSIPHTVCRTPEQSQDDRDAARRYMKTIPTSPRQGP